MNFLSNVLDSIPVVGHAKGVVHYAVGDKKGGDKAMHKSTKTTAAITVGAVGGVAGAVGGAINGAGKAIGGAIDGAAGAVGGEKDRPHKGNFISNALDATPVVGHAKGVLHYVVGDKDGGDYAMRRATKTSAAIAGGVIGVPAGAVGGAVGGAVNGAVGGAVVGGRLTDAVASGTKDKPRRNYEHRENNTNYY